MKAVFWLRMLAWIKRGVLALESIADSQKALAEAAVAPTRPRKSPKLAEVYVPDVGELNRQWQRDRDAEMYGEEPPE